MPVSVRVCVCVLPLKCLLYSANGSLWSPKTIDVIPFPFLPPQMRIMIDINNKDTISCVSALIAWIRMDASVCLAPYIWSVCVCMFEMHERHRVFWVKSICSVLSTAKRIDSHFWVFTKIKAQFALSSVPFYSHLFALAHADNWNEFSSHYLYKWLMGWQHLFKSTFNRLSHSLSVSQV